MTKRVARATMASAASAAIAYAIRKAAPVLREKLKALGDGAPGGETLTKAKDAVTEKVGSATAAVSDRIGSGSSSSQSGDASSGGGDAPSADELEKRREERAKNRKERQTAATK